MCLSTYRAVGTGIVSCWLPAELKANRCGGEPALLLRLPFYMLPNIIVDECHMYQAGDDNLVKKLLTAILYDERTCRRSIRRHQLSRPKKRHRQALHELRKHGCRSRLSDARTIKSP